MHGVNNIIGQHQMSESLSVSPFWTRRTTEIGKLSKTKLAFSYRVACNDHYFGTQCSLHCAPRNDKYGHYECSSGGQKLCLPGWTGNYCSEGKWRAAKQHLRKTYARCDALRLDKANRSPSKKKNQGAGESVPVRHSLASRGLAAGLGRDRLVPRAETTPPGLPCALRCVVEPASGCRAELVGRLPVGADAQLLATGLPVCCLYSGSFSLVSHGLGRLEDGDGIGSRG